MVKLIATDMDGTLINDDGKIDDRVFDLISRLNKNNVKFAAASGRFYSQLMVNFEKVKKNMIFIAHNGALIRYNHNGKVLYSNSILKQNIQKVINLNPNMGEELILSGENDAYVESPSQHIINVFSELKVHVVALKSFKQLREPVYKMTYHMANGVNQDIIKYLRENLNDELQFVVSGDRWIDIMNKGTNKGNAIRILQRKFDIDCKNTMVFGDYYNDLPMFKVAKYSYAMGNAPEDVKKSANFVARSNNDDGVYNVLKKYA